MSITHAGCALAPNEKVVRVDASDFFGDHELQYRQAMHAYRKGEIPRASRLLEKVLHANPRHASAHNNLGLIHYDARQLVPAAEHFERASQLRPQDPTPLNNLGMTLEAGGRIEEAIGYYTQAHSMLPKHSLYLGNLLRARVRLGENTPELIEDLKYLAFIEVRPAWVTWVDEVLALRLNPSLDRGPAVDTDSMQASDSAPSLAPILSPEDALPREILREELPSEESLDSSTSSATKSTWRQLEEQLPVPRP
ncbi:MAG: tetratricopeptide repeat protein [Planctomycetota bacterium]